MFHYPRIILASSSPRRRDILNQLQIPHDVIEPHIDETLDILNPSERVTTLAMKKAQAIQNAVDADMIIAADTIVALSKEVAPAHRDDIPQEYFIFEKPRNEDEARHMLTLLSGNTHTVYSGICVKYQDDLLVECDTTDVEFINIDTAILDAYIASKDWMGVAGGYKIQGLGAYFIKVIHGSYSNVMGLPIVLFFDMIKPYITL